MSSLDWNISSNPLRRRLRDLTIAERKEEAYTFLKLFYKENSSKITQPFESRWTEIQAQLNKESYYDHTYDELEFGAKVAWRNHSRCIGRLYWNSLIVNDYREITNPDEMAEKLQNHLDEAFNNGRIKSIISIFSPVKGEKLPAYIENYQLIQYAGYFDSLSGSIIGDKQNVAFTKMVSSLGWKADQNQNMFDVLPLCIRESGGKRILYKFKPDSIHEIHIQHPSCKKINDLNLKWYAIPVVSNMILTIGGIDYPCAPFNGFYMGTEIASRDFCDENRYNLIKKIASALGYSEENTPFSLWKDKVLTEINLAVLYSFQKSGVTIIDHHEASQQFMDFMSNERACDRSLSADWSWINPPHASSACPVFHLKMTDHHAVPNFYNSKLSDGGSLSPYYGDDFLTKNEARVLKWRKRMRRRFKRLVYRFSNSYKYWL